MRVHTVGPDVDYKRIKELADEFTLHWKRLHRFYLDSVAGYQFVLDQLEVEQKLARSFVSGTELDNQAFQDMRTFSYSDIFADDFCLSGIDLGTQSDVRVRNSLGGDNYIVLGQVCLVSFYDFWEEYLRPQYAIAKRLLDPSEKDGKAIERILSEHIRDDLWGDIRHLRNSIVHKLGIANSDVAKCKLIGWFKPGDRIALDPNRMRSIFLGLLIYRNRLDAEQYPRHTFTL